MCNFLSIVITKTGKVCYFTPQQAIKLGNSQSHSHISEVSDLDDDNVFKFEINPKTLEPKYDGGLPENGNYYPCRKCFEKILSRIKL